ncbi:hypothetical protein [Alloacidobacterium sp.]|uniref:hypothetical protein n=1 Tax=Alloacidobacterium sp. TaxID=2951999 RepID=UPI002D3C84DE|nr:hypothetical protein [Alloacidobacterium sp.]HYK34491.1 hypothetical protein [Alloacidobacterium sp.]
MTHGIKTKRSFCILSALSGILGVLMLITSFSINTGPPPGSSGPALERFVEQSYKSVLWGAWLQAVGPIFVVLFAFALVHLSGAERRISGWMTFFGATTLMTVNLIEVTFYICALFTTPSGMIDIGIRLISSVQHLYFIVSAPAVFLPLGIALINSRVIPRVLGYLALGLGATFALVGIASLLTLALPASITSLGSIQALWWLAAAFSLLFRSPTSVALDHSGEE